MVDAASGIWESPPLKPRAAAVKGGRRPATRTLDGCARSSVLLPIMGEAGRLAAGLDAIWCLCE